MKTTPKSKWIANSADFLYGTGLLGEINRLVLHPRGMALSVILDQENNAVFGVLYDYREDPEGMDYGPDDIQLIANKLAAAEADGLIPDGCSKQRLDMYPDGIQPLPTPNYEGYGEPKDEEHTQTATE